jgi:5-formaminoimidazole-4-carboxamide-1-beta-D-ribofuranosyl 5'-monophosphate synthetase
MSYNNNNIFLYIDQTHAEMQLFKLAKQKGIKTILICRTSKRGKVSPIDPCKACSKIAEKLNIKIVSLY